MISERIFSTMFSNFWEDLFPLLTKGYMHTFNASFGEDLKFQGNRVYEIANCVGKRNGALVAELSYRLAKIANEENYSIDQLFEKKELFDKINSSCLKIIKNFEPKTKELETPEISEALLIAKNYQLFFEQMDYNEVMFDFPLSGAGIIDNCGLDIVCDGVLCEVKTVNRNITNKDLKQVFTYLALSNAEGKQYETAVIFNPKRALFYKFKVSSILSHLSGGLSTTEVFYELLEFLQMSDVHIEKRF